MFAARRPEAVRELETLQQHERQGAGEPDLTTDDFLRLLRQDLEMEFIDWHLDRGGLSAAIEGVGDMESWVNQRSESLLTEWQLDDPNQWSRYETPSARWGIARTCSRIEAVFAQHGWHLPELPVVGTLTTGQVSAVTQQSSSGAPLVLIDNGFFRFSGTMAQLAVFAPYDAIMRDDFTEATLQLVADLAATHTVLNTCLYLYRRTTPPEFEGQVASFQDAVSLFVLAHEYGHIAAGDLDAHPFEGSPATGDLRSREFAADRIGFLTSVEAKRDDGSAESGVFGPFLFLAGLDLLDRATAAYHGRAPALESGPSDYPTPFERTVKLLEWLEGSAYAAEFADQITAASSSYNIILLAWDRILPAFMAVRHELAAYDPSLHGPSVYQDADTFGLVQTLWRHVLTLLHGR